MWQWCRETMNGSTSSATRLRTWGTCTLAYWIFWESTSIAEGMDSDLKWNVWVQGGVWRCIQVTHLPTSTSVTMYSVVTAFYQRDNWYDCAFSSSKKLQLQIKANLRRCLYLVHVTVFLQSIWFARGHHQRVWAATPAKLSRCPFASCDGWRM